MSEANSLPSNDWSEPWRKYGIDCCYQRPLSKPRVRVPYAVRDKDKTHLRDMLDVGLIDASWPARYPTALADRLQQLIDTPGG